MIKNIVIISVLFFLFNYNVAPIFQYHAITDSLRDLILIAFFLINTFIFFLKNNFEAYSTILLLIILSLLMLNWAKFPISDLFLPIFTILYSYILTNNIVNFKDEVSIVRMRSIFFIFLLISSYSTYTFLQILLTSIQSGVENEINRQGLALFFLTLPFIYKLFEIFYQEKTNDMFFVFITLMCLSNAFILQSRTATLFVATYLLLHLLFSKKRFIFLGAYIALFLPLLIIFFEELVDLVPRIFNFSLDGDIANNSILGRFEHYDRATEKIILYPFGSIPMQNFLNSDYPHNFVLEILIDLGLLFGSLVICLLLYLLLKNLRIGIWSTPILFGLLLSWSIYNSKIFFLLTFLFIMLKDSKFNKFRAA